MQFNKNKNDKLLKRNPLVSRDIGEKNGHNINVGTNGKKREVVVTFTPSLLVLASYILLLIKHLHTRNGDLKWRKNIRRTKK